MLTEEYEVKFWFTNAHGYKEQGIETFKCNSKCAHKKAEATIKKKWFKEHNQKIEIISVVYQ
jgi:hypothetical protein